MTQPDGARGGENRMWRWAMIWLLVPGSGWASEAYSTDGFAPGDEPAGVVLEGHVTFSASGLSLTMITNAPFMPAIPHDLPTIEVDLVRRGQDLLPVQRGLVTSAHPVFDYFVSPGRVWSEGEYAHASLPFTLMNRIVNCAHNGLLTFRYTATRIEEVRVLVNQETCHFTKFDLWGEGLARYTPGPVAGADATRAAFASEQAQRIPTKPLAALATDYGADLALLLTGLPTNDDLTTAGVYFEGTHYTTPCNTRGGAHPYCGHMLLTSFSTAKTAFPALVLMSLAQRDGPEVYRQRIIDHLPEARSAKGDWQRVTFDQVGDMTSGNFSDGAPLADASPGNFYSDLGRNGKLAAAFGWPNRADAGSRFVYQTADTFILVNALDHYLRGDSFDYLVETIMKPLHLPPEVMVSRRTRDHEQNNSGTAFGGMGMWWTGDAIVKLARFLSIEDGRIEGRQVLHPQALAATLQRDPGDRGIQTGVGATFYNNGTWALPARVLGERFACDPWVPFMTGLSGVRVTMMPNDMIFYYFNDAQAFPLEESVIAADQVRPFCARTR